MEKSEKNFFPILDLAQCVSAVFCTITCNAHITSCEHQLSCVTTAWVPLTGASLILWRSYMCLLPQAHCQTSTSADSVSPRALIFTPACGPCTQQHFSIRKTGKVKLGVNVMTFVSNLSLSHCAHRGFPFICFSSFASFCYFSSLLIFSVFI